MPKDMDKQLFRTMPKCIKIWSHDSYRIGAPNSVGFGAMSPIELEPRVL